MQLHKFIGKTFLPLPSNAVMVCNDKLKGLSLEVIDAEGLFTKSRLYNAKIYDVGVVGVHNGWRTNHKPLQFKAVIDSISLSISYQRGIDNNEEAHQYSLYFKVWGLLKYKYQRSDYRAEVFSYYDYDTDITVLLDRLIAYIDTLPQDIILCLNRQ